MDEIVLTPSLRLATSLISAGISALVGWFVLGRARQQPVNRVIAGIATASMLYNIFQIIFQILPSIWFVRAGWIGTILLIPLLAEFPDAVLEGRYARTRTRAMAWSAATVFLLALPTNLIFRGELELTPDGPLAIGGALMKGYAFAMGVLLVRIAYRLLKARFTHPDEMMRRRVEFILLGEAFYCLCALHDMLLRHQIFWVFEFPIVEWATLAFMIIVVYATMRFKLVDIDVVIGTGVYYMLLTLGTAALYKTVENILQDDLKKYIDEHSWWAQILPAFAVALLIEPANMLIQRLTEGWFLEPKFRKMGIFRSPNFQYLVLNGKLDELRKLRSELDQLVEHAAGTSPVSPTDRDST
ncbi:MAG TPA: hypothetical protein PLP29_14100 [Candidatus Ozemobacteraceae bacterium]|nr:hypothetical protein [Candidatus Ozemobacteraceae bacterium]